LFHTGRGPERDDPFGTTSPKHARPSIKFPFKVKLDGRLFELSPASPVGRTRETIVLTGHGADVTDADVVEAPTGAAALISSSIDGSVRVWDVAAGIPAGCLPAGLASCTVCRRR
jgi:WD40 repeat protein